MEHCSRIPYWDPRNAEYDLTNVAPELACRPLVELKGVRKYQQQWWGHQQNDSMSMAYALLHLLSMDNPTHPRFGPMQSPSSLHSQLVYEDRKHNRIHLNGATTLAACRIAQKMGWVQNYYWATDVLAALNYLHDVGPLLCSTRWYDSLFDRNERSEVRIASNATELPGLVYCVSGIYPKSGLIRLAQTWGGGYYFMSFATFDHLIQNGGEVALLRGLPTRGH